MSYRHLIGIDELSTSQVGRIIELTYEVKANPNKFRAALPGKALAMIFQKPSTRTRVSFQVGIHQLGGYALVLGQNDLQLGRGETLADTARVLSRYVDAIMARVFGHRDVVELARFSSVPVINGLSDHSHPCQACATTSPSRSVSASCAVCRSPMSGTATTSHTPSPTAPRGWE